MTRTNGLRRASSLCFIIAVASCIAVEPRPWNADDGAGGGGAVNDPGTGVEDVGEGVMGGSGVFGLELLAGSLGGRGNADGTGGAAAFDLPMSVAVDGAGNVYVADARNNTIRKVTAAGGVTTFAGIAGVAGGIDGVGAAALLSMPNGVAVDAAGNVYVADTGNSTIRKITPAGVATTLAGTARETGARDGAGAAARFNLPNGVAVDSAGNVFVADTQNQTVRKVTAAGVVTTFAGTAGLGGSTDGTGAAARFYTPTGVAVDAAGNVFVADQGNQTIRKITADGVVTTLAGLAGIAGTANGTGAAARFDHPTGVAVDGAGNVYVAEEFNCAIRKITPAGVVTTFAGFVGVGGIADGTGRAARFMFPAGTAVDGAGNVYVADAFNNTIRKITPAATVTTLAGTASAAGETDGPGAIARFNGPTGVAVDRAGHVFVTDAATVRRISSLGVTTFAGSGRLGSADGPGASAQFNGPAGLKVDGAGNVYVADEGNETIRKITTRHVVATLAGNAGERGSVDGPGAAARFNGPAGAAVDSAGNVFVADLANYVIRKVSPTGVVTTFAGTAGVRGSADGIGRAAQFEVPTDVALDGAGNLYVADFGAHTIRKITPAGVVTTLAGRADIPGSADGTGAAARFNRPTGVAVDGAGNVYVTDTYNATIRKITPTGIVTTVAGTAGVAGLVLGPTPRLGYPMYLAVGDDSLVITDNRAVLLLRHGAR